MPILPPANTNPYPTVEEALQLARVKINDAMRDLAGEILTDVAPFTHTIVNSAWRSLQRYLDNLGLNRLINEVVVYGIPPITSVSQDPALQVWLNWQQYFDGINYYTAPVLPPDFISPIWLKERWSGGNSLFRPMTFAIDGLPTRPRQQGNVYWEWRNDCIYMLGSTMVTDLRIRYKAFLPDFIDTGGVPWYQQKMAFVDCQEAMAEYICYVFCKARGDQGADDFLSKAEKSADLIFNRDISAKQRTNVRRRPRSGRSSSGGWSW